AELKLWKSYRIALDDVDVSAAPDIEWPNQPE
ncbi:tail fiber assembly protein, partial [Yersinia enterocolitica]